jgi:hypothetical protein
MRYLSARKDLMRYAEAHRHGFPIGSGAVEATCKSLVSQRMKLCLLRTPSTAQSLMFSRLGRSSPTPMVRWLYVLLAAAKSPQNESLMSSRRQRA